MNGPEPRDRPAPEFELETTAGERFALADVRGRHVVLFFIREFT
jgi:peroxiredoxin